MALSSEIKFPAPVGDHTVCFFTFGKERMSASMKNDEGQNASLEINKKGHYCVVVQNLKITVSYVYLLVRFLEGPRSPIF